MTDAIQDLLPLVRYNPGKKHTHSYLGPCLFATQHIRVDNETGQM